MSGHSDYLLDHYSLVVLVCLLAVLVSPHVVLVFPLVVLVCPLVVSVCPLAVPVEISVGLVIADPFMGYLFLNLVIKKVNFLIFYL